MAGIDAAILELGAVKDESASSPSPKKAQQPDALVVAEASNPRQSPNSSALMAGRLETVKEVVTLPDVSDSPESDNLEVVIESSDVGSHRPSPKQSPPIGGRLEVVKECASDDTIRADDLCTCSHKKDPEIEKLVPNDYSPSKSNHGARNATTPDDGGTSTAHAPYSIMKKKPRSFSLDYGRVNYLSNEPPSDYLARPRRKVSIISTDSERCQNCGNYTTSLQSDLDLQKPGVKFLDELEQEKNAQYYNQSKPRKYLAAVLAAGFLLIFILVIVVVLVVLSKSKKS